MVEEIKKSIKVNEESSSNYYEFDWNIIFNFFKRNRNFLGKISFIFLILGFIYSFIPKKVWEGQFQIVLKLESNNRLGIRDPRLVRLSGNANNLATEVGILKSPSVLMPVYEFMISKKENDLNNKNDLNKKNGFLEWKNDNLTIGLEGRTSILNISYRDNNKEVIIPVLEKMSSSYQKYSQFSKNKLLEASRNNLKKQIEDFKVISANSQKTAQEFAIDEDLFFFDTSIRGRTPNIDNQNIRNNRQLINDSFPKTTSNLENVRVEAINKIRKIDSQLQKIEELNTVGELKAIGSTIPSIMIQSGLGEGLEKIDNELVELRSKYTEEDISIKRLLEKRKYMLEALKRRSINYLKAERLEAEATKQSVARPKDVLLKYKELIRIADRDEFTLISLENQLRSNELELYKKKYPWELITKPTLLNKHVSPIKLNLTFFSFLIGLSFGSIYIFYREKKSGKIFNLKKILEIRSFEFVEGISLNNNQLNKDKFLFIKDYLKNNSQENGNIIFLGDLNENKKSQIRSTFLEEINKKLVFIKNLTDIEKSKNKNINLLVLSLGDVKYSQIEILDKYAELLNINIPGLIILED